ncbi:MAG: pyridoxal-phosphate dependent enzyme [Gemmobacter sp.]
MPIPAILTDTAARSRAAQARLADHVLTTPLLPSATTPGLWYKCENFQRTGSFKIRGALSKLTTLPRDRPVITASSGNHGIACSQAAALTGHDLTVVLPENVSRAKLATIRSYGTKVVLHGADSGLAEAHAQRLAQDGPVYVSPYNDPQVIAGQGTVALELLDQLDRIDTVFVAMGGGGLISGIGAVLKDARPEVRVIGVSATASAALAASMAAGRVVETEHHDTLADGVAGSMDDGAITLPLAMACVDRVLHCTEDEIAAALRHLAWNEHMLVEGAAALALAGFTQIADDVAGGVSVVVLCGANFDRTKVLAVLAD